MTETDGTGTEGTETNWDQPGTLRHSLGGYDIRTGPLWLLIIAARQGHEGTLEAMEIHLSDGRVLSPAEIAALAIEPGRKLRG